MKKLLFLFAVLLTSVGAWAQTETYYRLDAAAQTLTNGKYVIQAMSNKGVGPVYYHEAGSEKHYRYDVGVGAVQQGAALKSKYVWDVELVAEGTKVTIKLSDDNNKFFVKDAARNKNFNGTEQAELFFEEHTIGEKKYFALKIEDNATADNAVGYIHANSPGGNPNLSYWNAYGDDGTCVKFQFYPATPIEGDITKTYTYNFKDENGLIATRTQEAQEFYPDATSFLRVPADYVTLTGAPSGLVYGEQTEFDIKVSYKAEFPFVPTTIVEGEFAEGTKWYNMTMREKKKRLKNENGNVKINKSFNDQDDSNQYFAFSGDAINGFKLHNRSVGASKSFSVAYSQEKNLGSFSDDGVALELFRVNNAWQLAPIDRTNDNARLHDFIDERLGCWVHNSAPGDAGSNLTIFCVDIESGKITANFQFKLGGVVKYEKELTYYAGYDLPDLLEESNAYYAVNLLGNYDYMPAQAGDFEVQWASATPFRYSLDDTNITNWYYIQLHSNNKKYIQYISDDKPIEWYDAQMDLEKLDTYSWAFVGNPFDGFKILNRAVGFATGLCSTGSGDPKMSTYENATKFVYTSGAVEDGFCFRYPGGSNYLNGQNAKVAHHNANDAGSTMLVSEVIPVMLTTNDNSPIYYKIKSGRSGEWWYINESDKIKLNALTGTDNDYWYFKGLFNNSNKLQVQLFSKAGAGKAMSYATNGVSDGADKIIAKPIGEDDYTSTWTFTSTDGSAPYGLKPTVGNTFLSNWGGTGNAMGFYNSQTDDGSKIYFSIEPTFVQEYTRSGDFWDNGLTTYPSGLNNKRECGGGKGNATGHIGVSGHSVYMASVPVEANNSRATVLFQWKNETGNSHGISILGVDLVDNNGNVVGYDYHLGFSGGSSYSNTYYLPTIASGTYMLRYYVCNNGSDGHSLTLTGGSITVEGLSQSTDEQFKTYFDALKSVAQTKSAWAIDEKKGTYGYYTAESADLFNVAYNNAAADQETPPTNTIVNRLIEALSSLEMVVPQTGRYYRFKGKASGKYITGAWNGNTIAAGSKFKLADKTGEHEDATIFYLTEDNKLINYRTGTYLKETHTVGNTNDDGNIISFNTSESNNAGYYTIKTDYTSPYMYDDNRDTELDRNGSYAAGNCEWEVEDVIGLPVNISLEGVTTLYAPCALTIPDGVKAKYVKAENNKNTSGNLNYTELTGGVIPANAPVVIEGNPGAYMFNIIDEAVETVEDNVLFGFHHKTNVSASTHTDNVYNIATDKKGRIAFYEYEGTEYQAYAAYLDVTSLNVQGTPEYFNVVDMSNYFVLQTSVEGWTENNPNTHLGTITLTNGENNVARKMEASASDNYYYKLDKSLNTTLALTRKYRGYEFLGFWLGEKELGLTPTLTAEQVNAVNEANPIIAKYKPTDEVTLFYDDDPFSYRIPAIGKTSTGRLIAVSDYRYSLDDIGRYNFGEANPGIDLVMRYSDDNGKTWSETKTIAKCSGKRGTNDCAYGDAAIAVVGQKVLVMGAAGDVVFNGGTATNHNRTVRIFSEDNGQTWTAPQDISETLFIGDDATIQNGYTAFFGSGKLAVDENYNGTGKARIYGAMLIKKEGYDNAIYVIYTDDFGVNWSILGGSQTHITANDEPKVEILPSGQILLSVRRGGGRQFNVFTYSDKATNAGSWNGNADGCSNGGKNTCNGEIFLVDAKKADESDVKLLLQSQPKGGGGLYDRRDVTIWYKEITDATYTSSEIAGNWIQGMQVSTQQSSYSTMVLQNDGKIAFFFEEAPCYGDDQAKGYCMVYTPITIENITKGHYFSPTTALDATQTISVVLTDAQGNDYRDQVESTIAGVAAALATKYPFITLGDNVGINLVDESYTYTNTVTLPFKVSNENGTYWHNIYIPTYGNSERYPVYFYATSNTDEIVKTTKESCIYGASQYNTKDHENKMSWAVYSVGNAFTFKFKNKETQKYIKVTTSASGSSKNVEYGNELEATAFDIKNKTNSNHKGDYIIMHGEAHLSVCSSDKDDYLTFYKGNEHYGSTVKFVDAPDFDALIDDANDVLSWIGEGLGKYTVSESNTAIVETAKTAMQTPNRVMLNELNRYKNLMEGATLNMPKAGTFLRISHDFGDAGVKYLQGVASSVNKSNQITPPVSYDGEKGAASIFYYSGSKLLSYTAGTYLREQDNYRGLQGVGVDGGNVTFGKSPRAKGKYTIRIPSYLHANTTNSNYHSDHCSGDDHDAHDHSIESVTSLPFTFNPAGLGFATFNAPVAVELPEGVLAYVTQIKLDNNTLQMYRLEDKVVPANTPVMLYCEAAKTEGATKELKIVSTYTGNEFDGFKYNESFYGTIDAEPYPTGCTIYSLRKSAGKNTVGFYQKASGNLGGFKAWIKLDEEPDAQGARTFTIIFDGDDATGLKEALGLENENVEIYDLSGRRLDKPTKGVNVIGGKLVIK